MNDRQMPEPIATMIREHETLLILLDDLSNCVVENGIPNILKLKELVNNFLNCMNAHVYKEEEILFPYIRVALGNDVEALQMFEDEHVVVSDLLSHFSDLAKRLIENEACDSDNIARIADITSQARKVMPPHIFKEDHVLYPLASKIISQKTFKKLAVEATNCSKSTA